MKKHTNNKSGFTLVELAIVLVIIGLIVGGVLVGADLIKAATQQKAVKQIADTEAGATTFRVKYNDLPGDLRNATAVFPAITNSSVNPGGGNGDGLIQAAATGTTAVASPLFGVTGEVAAFYPELSLAGYVKEAFAPVSMTDVTLAQAVINSATNTGVFAPSPLGKGAKLAAATDGGINYIVLFGDTTGAAAAGVATFTQGGITPLQASNFDTKLDDGVGTTGNVRTMAVVAPVNVGQADTTNNCANFTTGVYNSATTATTPVCNLTFRGSF